MSDSASSRSAQPTLPIAVAMLAIDDALASSMTAPLDAFRVANALYRRLHPGQGDAFALSLVSARGETEVNCAGELTVGGLRAMPADCRVLLIPGLAYHGAADLYDKAATLKPELALIAACSARKLRIATSCSGTFVLAASGALRGHSATTSWWLAPAFAQLYPDVKLDATQIIVESAHLVTAGAVTAMFDVVLNLIASQIGPALAQHTARILLVEQGRVSQAPYVTEALIQRPRDAFSERVEQYLQHHLHAPLSIEALAQVNNMSTRTLLRRFTQIYQRSPQAYLQELRIERAKALLERSGMTLHEIMAQCGYGDIASFRKLFKRLTGLTPAVYRQRFSLRGP